MDSSANSLGEVLITCQAMAICGQLGKLREYQQTVLTDWESRELDSLSSAEHWARLMLLRAFAEVWLGSGPEEGAPTAEQRASAQAALNTCDELCLSYPGSAVLAGLQLQAACLASLAGVRPLSVEAVAGVCLSPAQAHDRQLWSVISFWAFVMSEAELLFEAYSRHLTVFKSNLSRYNWERTRLMYLLSVGQAIFRDIEGVIDKFPGLCQARSFGAFLRPACKAQDMWDERLLIKYDLRLIDLEDSSPIQAAGHITYAMSWDGIEYQTTPQAESEGDVQSSHTHTRL